jgi:hypothetical protein
VRSFCLSATTSLFWNDVAEYKKWERVGHVSQILPEGSFSGLLEPNKIAEEDTTTRNIHFRISGAAPVFAYFEQSLTGSRPTVCLILNNIYVTRGTYSIASTNFWSENAKKEEKWNTLVCQP